MRVGVWGHSHMRCALATAEGAGRCVTGYDVRGCGALNPTRKAHVCDEDGRVGDPKLRSNLMCVSWYVHPPLHPCTSILH